MNTSIKHIAAMLAVTAAVATMSAQNTYSGYFIDNYTYRYQMNPAMGNERGFVAMPGLGNLNVGLKGNLNLDQVVYNVDGRTVLFTNPDVSTAEAMKKVHKSNELNMNLKETILAAGFHGMGGYNTVTISAVANAGVGVPGSFFSLAKEGITNKTYDISDLRVQANAYADISLNHSHDLSSVLPGLRVGATLKVLVGVGNLDAYLHQADLTLGTDNWIARTNADIYSSVKGLGFKHEVNKQGREYVSGIEMDKFAIQGFGLGFDLGALYKRGDWQFSLAVLDLGFISYPQTRLASTDGLQTIETNAYTFSADGNADNSFKNEWRRMRDNLFDLYQLNDKGDVGSRTRSLATTLNFGASYELPAYRNLHFGLMNTTRLAGAFTTTEFRLSANVRPVKCFSADANIAVGTYGAAFGWLLNLNVPGFNMFLGMDRTVGRLAKQGVPLKSSAAVNFGIDFPF